MSLEGTACIGNAGASSDAIDRVLLQSKTCLLLALAHCVWHQECWCGGSKSKLGHLSRGMCRCVKDCRRVCWSLEPSRAKACLNPLTPE